MKKFNLIFIFAVGVVILFSGVYKFGLLDPWEMNRAFISQLMTGKNRVLIAGNVDDKTLSEIKTKTRKTSTIFYTLPNGTNPKFFLSNQASYLRKQLFHIVGVFVDGKIKDKKSIVDVISLWRKNNPGTVFILVSNGGFPETKNLFDATVKNADEFVSKLNDDYKNVHWFRAQFKKSGMLYSLPVLDFWLTALSFKIFGFTEFSVRVMPVVFGILLIFLIFYIGKNIYRDEDVALIGALVLTTSPIFFLTMKTNTEFISFPLLLTFNALSLYLFAEKGVKTGNVVLFFVSMILGFLAIGLTFVLIVILLYLSYFIVLKKYKEFPHVILLASSVVIFGALIFAVLSPDHWTFFSHFKFMHKNFEGGISFMDRNFDFFVNQVGFGTFPYSFLVPFAFGYLFIKNRNNPDAKDVLTILWFSIPFVILAAMLIDFSHSLYGAYPSIALAIGIYGKELIKDESLRWKALGFFGFIMFFILLTQVKDSAEPIFNIMTTDPQIFVEHGEMKLPHIVSFNKLIILFLLLGGGLAFNYYTKFSTHFGEFLRKINNKKHLLVATFSCVILFFIDVIASIIWRINITVYSQAGRKLPVADRTFVIKLFGFRAETIFFYILFSILLIIYILKHFGGIKLSFLDKFIQLWKKIPEKIRVLILPGVLLLGGIFLVVGGFGGFEYQKFLIYLKSRIFMSFLFIALSILFLWILHYFKKFKISYVFYLVTAGLFILETSVARNLALNNWLYWTVLVIFMILVMLELLSASFDDPLKSLTVLFGILIFFGVYYLSPLLMEWLNITRILFPSLTENYPVKLFFKSFDVLFIYLLFAVVAGNYLYRHKESFMDFVKKHRLFVLALNVFVVLFAVPVYLKKFIIFTPTFSRAFGKVLFLTPVVSVITYIYIAKRNLIVKFFNSLKNRKTVTYSFLIGVIFSVIYLVLYLIFSTFGDGNISGGKLIILNVFLILFVLSFAISVLFYVIDDAELFSFPVKLEEPRKFFVLFGIIGFIFAFYTGYHLFAKFSFNFSQKHIIETYLKREHRKDIGSNIFKHGTFTKGDKEDVNFYTNSIPEVRDRRKIIQILTATNDVPVKLNYSRITDKPEYIVVKGFDPVNDENRDGRRDYMADSGIATFVSEGKIVDKYKHWKNGQWKDFYVFGKGDMKFKILDNTENELKIDGLFNFFAYNPIYNTYFIDNEKSKNHKATAMTRPFYYVIFPKKSFSEINYEFRKQNNGRSIPVIDDRSQNFILATNYLKKDEVDKNWIAKHLLTEEEFKKDKSIKKAYAKFEDKIEFIGYKLKSESVSRGSNYEIYLYFKCIGKMKTSYRIFMHIDKPGSAHRIHGDHWPLNLHKPKEENDTCDGCFKTTHWLVGDIVEDYFVGEVPIGTPSGSQDIWIGFYNPATDKRLKVVDYDKKTVVHDGNNRIKIGMFVVP